MRPLAAVQKIYQIVIRYVSKTRGVKLDLLFKAFHPRLIDLVIIDRADEREKSSALDEMAKRVDAKDIQQFSEAELYGSAVHLHCR